MSRGDQSYATQVANGFFNALKGFAELKIPLACDHETPAANREGGSCWIAVRRRFGIGDVNVKRLENECTEEAGRTAQFPS